MKTLTTIFAAVCTVAFLTSAHAATEKAKPVRTAKSLECSKQADAQKIHGKPRKEFMSKCKKS